MKKFIALAALLTAGLLTAETITLTQSANFAPAKGITAAADGTLSFKGTVATYSSKAFDFDPAKKYTVSGEFRQTAGKTRAVLFFGFVPIDKNGRQILTPHTLIIPGTDTVLSADVAAGAKEITVKDASKWKKGYRFALNTDPSLKDLPNYSVIFSEMTAAVKTGDVWKVSFNRPIRIALKKGTCVRQHGLGGAMYPAAPAIRINAKWQTFTGTSSGIYKTHGYSPKKFPVGTAKVRLLLFANYGQKDAVTEVKNLTLKVE